MRSYALLTVLVAAVTGSSELCPYQATPDSGLAVLHAMLAEVNACSKSSDAFTQSLTSAVDTDDFRRVFRTACSNEAAVRACVADVNAVADVCLEGTQRNLWTTVIAFVQTGIAATCGDGGELVATVYGDELQAMDAGSRRRTVSCLYGIASGSLLGSETDLAAVTARKYNAMKDGTRCIVNVARNSRTSSTQFQRFMDQMLVNMECLSPTTNDIVLCSTLQPADPTA